MKILYVSTLSNTINAFMIPHIEYLIQKGYQVDIACNVERAVDARLINKGCKIFNLPFQRSIKSFQNYTAYKKLKKLIVENNYDIVHTHTPIASACVRIACKRHKNLKVFYTAHGFHFYKGAPLKNWLTFYPIEKYLSKFTELIITINNEDFKRAKKSFHSKNVTYLPSVGLDITKYRNISVDRLSKLNELGIPENAFVILSVGEINNNKNHATIIKAIAKVNNPNIYYVICGQGPLLSYLTNLARELGISTQVKLVGFRKDIPEICKIANVFAFPSKREGLGMAALEAMSAGLPIITSNVHGIVDYSIQNVTGYTTSPLDVEGFACAIAKIESNRDLLDKMGKYNSEMVEKFSIAKVLNVLEDIYS